jgi:hypothetical protein
MTDLQSFRWGRILLGGFLIELVLMLLVIPLYALGSGEDAVTALAVGGSFLVAVAIAAWLCRPLAKPVVQGLLMGAVGAAIYLVLQIASQAFAPTPTAVPLIYYFAHVLKVAGGAAGGWWAARGRVVTSRA